MVNNNQTRNKANKANITAQHTTDLGSERRLAGRELFVLVPELGHLLFQFPAVRRQHTVELLLLGQPVLQRLQLADLDSQSLLRAELLGDDFPGELHGFVGVR
jgi:hypothetical protein